MHNSDDSRPSLTARARTLIAAIIGALALIGGAAAGVVLLLDAGDKTIRAVEEALAHPAQPGKAQAESAGWWPERKGFSYAPCEQPGEICGSSTGPVFNSFVATPSYGDERPFLDARRSDQTQSGAYENILRDVTEGSSTVVLRIYVHNNADPETNATGLGIARGTRVRVGVPNVSATALQATASITADNARPRRVQDTVQLTASRRFRVAYIPGSAWVYSNEGRFRLSDSIVSQTGAQVGTRRPDGIVPGSFRNDLTVQLQLRVSGD